MAATASGDARPADRPRWVLLGASNVARSWPRLVALCQARSNRPPEILAALGRGRSYGGWHSFLGRQMPGIVDCGLWAALAAGAERPTRAVVTDIGNDLVYGHVPQTIALWVDACLARLQDARAEILMTRLPMASVRRITPGQFQFFRRLFFPNASIDLATVRVRAEELDDRIGELARRRGVQDFEHASSWYGLDPIHIRSSVCDEAWSAMLDALPAGATHENGRAQKEDAAIPPRASASQIARLRARERYRLLTMRPELWRRWGRESHQAQPACMLPSGAAVSFY